MSDSDGSFDPKTWSAGPVAAAVAPVDVAPPRIRAATLDLRSPVAVGGYTVAILLLGGLVALTLGTPVLVPPPQAAAVVIAVAPVAAARRTLVLARAADLYVALRDAGVRDSDVTGAAIAAAPAMAGHNGEVRATLSLSGDALNRLDLAFSDGSSAVVEPGVGRFTATTAIAALDSRITVVRGEMDANSFYSSAVAAGVVDSLIPAFASALAFDFDFQREIQPGDVFEAAFSQARDADGRAIGSPLLVYASISTAAKSRALYRFDAAGESGWFDGNGASTVRTLMRTPVDGARVSSQFGMRTHPVLGFQKLHEGTDFAAPIGTPIYAAGAATVEFSGFKGPNGNFVKLRHSNGWETLYLHMVRIEPAVVAGAAVAQGQQIGAIGTTGRSTGPHLHYAVRIEDKFVDPQTIEMESARRLAGAARAAFIAERDRIDAARAHGSGA